MMRISWHKTAIKQGKNGCKKAENTVIKIISDRTALPGQPTKVCLLGLRALFKFKENLFRTLEKIITSF